MDEWPVIDAETEYETDWYTGGYDLVAQPDGSRKRYYWADLPPAVVVVAIDNNEIIFVEQYRPVIREHCLELPAGIVEADEDFETAGARELEEETGFKPANVTLLEAFWTATGVLRHRRGIVAATDLTSTTQTLDQNEFLSCRRIPVDDALAAARTEPVNDATIEGILLAKTDGFL